MLLFPLKTGEPEKIFPLGDDFTPEYFHSLFARLPAEDMSSIKYFMISKPAVWGVGNGYLQDILFRAKLHPRHRAVEVSKSEQDRLYTAVREILAQAVKVGGRESEADLFGNPGGYHKILDSKSVGEPCEVCGTLIEKIQFLGGASYFCPNCQK